MGAPFAETDITGFNDNPPPDDGSQSEENRIKWETIKEKLVDPLKTAFEASETTTLAAFGKIIGGGASTSSAISATVGSSDQGKLYRATASGITITSADATSVQAPFVFGLLNSSDGDITFDGNGSQTVDGDASITLGAREGVLVWTDGSNWFTVGRAPSRQIPPQGYLTLTTATPVITGDVAAATAIYYTPDTGNLIPIPDGTKFAVREFSELTLTLHANHVASAIYDVFAFSDSGTIRLGTGPAWTTATAGSGARGTGAGTTELERLKGLFVNKVSMTARNGATTYSVAAKAGIFLGSIFMDGTNGQISCHRAFGQSRKWGVWNAFNRKPIILKAGDSTASWTYDTNTLRASNNASANLVTVFSGLADESFDTTFEQNVDCGSASATTQVNEQCKIGIGVNSTTAASGRMGTARSVGSTSSGGNLGMSVGTCLVARHVVAPALGIQNIQATEIVTSDTANHTSTFYGGEDDMLLSARWMG